MCECEWSPLFPPTKRFCRTFSITHSTKRPRIALTIRWVKVTLLRRCYSSSQQLLKERKAARHPRGRGQASVNRKEGCGVRPAKPSVWRVALPLRPHVYSVHDQCGCEFMDQFSLRGGHATPGTGTRRFLKGRNAQISYDFARIVRMAHDNLCAFIFAATRRWTRNEEPANGLDLDLNHPWRRAKALHLHFAAPPLTRWACGNRVDTQAQRPERWCLSTVRATRRLIQLFLVLCPSAHEFQGFVSGINETAPLLSRYVFGHTMRCVACSGWSWWWWRVSSSGIASISAVSRREKRSSRFGLLAGTGPAAPDCVARCPRAKFILIFIHSAQSAFEKKRRWRRATMNWQRSHFCARTVPGQDIGQLIALVLGRFFVCFLPCVRFHRHTHIGLTDRTPPSHRSIEAED